MKKLFTFILMACMAFAFTAAPGKAHAQSPSVMTQTSTAGATKSVNTNADTSYHTVDLASPLSNYRYITITLAGTKTSGTVGGNAIVQASLDNSRWFTIGDSSGVTTQTLADGNNDKKWEFNATKWRYYRVRVATSGTQVSSYKCYFLGRKEPNPPAPAPVPYIPEKKREMKKP